MLETKPPPVTAANPAARRTNSEHRNAVARQNTDEWQGAPARRSTRVRPAIDTRPRPVSPKVPKRLAQSETRLVRMVLLSTTLVCGLLVLYLTAYARVTLLGIENAHARAEINNKQKEVEQLAASYAGLRSPHRIAALAVDLGMTLRPSHVDYIPYVPDDMQSQSRKPIQAVR